MPQWWTSAVVYQIYPRSFADSNGDGIGDLPGIESKLDYLADLGVDVLWLSPIYRSPQDDNGYDISDYRDIDPMFGTLADFDRLLAQVHARGMKLVMDLVVNHTSDEHPWFEQSRSSTDNPKRDWYWWRPPAADGGPPNNWGSIFSGSAWEFDETTGEYYLHLFSRKQPDLNWENPQVRRGVYDLMNWWLDRGVDGFRMDVINLISKHAGLPDGIIPVGDLYGDGGPYFMNGPRLHEFLQEMHQQVFAGRDADLLTVGECPGSSVELARMLTDGERHELDMVFQFEHMELDQGRTKWDHKPLHLPDLKQNLAKWQYGLADVGWNSLYFNNHDRPRSVSRFGDSDYWYESATLLAAVLHLHRGTPYVYQGEELGMTNYPFTDIGEFADIEALNYYHQAVDEQGLDPRLVLQSLEIAARDNSRTPMQWDGSAQAGFTTGTPWLAVNPNASRINAEAQVKDPESVFAWYRELIAMRHRDVVVRHGAFELLLPADPQVYAFTRTLDAQRLLVVANFSSEPAEPALDMDGQIEVCNYREPVTDHLRPWEVRVYRQRVA